MITVNKRVLIGAGAVLLAGCIVREEPRPRRIMVVESPPPLVEVGPAPGAVEVVPASPGPEYVYEPGVYVWVDGHRMWRRGYWHHRY